MTLDGDLVTQALRQPGTVGDGPPGRQAALLHQARRAGLVGRIALAAAGSDGLAPGLRSAFIAADRVSRAQQAEIERESAYLAHALQGLGAPVVLLKGAAYAAAGLPAARGRVFGDIDILVPRAVLDEVEQRLTIAGWRFGQLSAYENLHYRRWSHELPPMTHMHRNTALDVHHAILPPTARWQPDTAALFSAARPLPRHPGLCVLGPEDMVLHSMTHLVVNDDVGYALRDLSDLDLLLRHFDTVEAGFWPRLLARAQQHGLQRALYHGLRQLVRVLGTPVPDQTMEAVQAWAPGALQAAAMDFIWQRMLRSPHPDAALPGAGLAWLALYLRAHWLRMPLPLLMRHLATKTWMALQRAPKRPDAQV